MAITSSSSLDINLFKELGRKNLIDALNSVSGAKTLVLDASLAGPLSLITEVSLLKHQGVDKMFWLESGPLTSPTTNIVYLCRPLVRNVKIICDQIKRHTKESINHTYTLLLVPRVSTLVSRILEEEGVLGDVRISPYNLQFIPIAEDVISLEHDSAFKEIWVDGDESAIFDSAQALITLQKLFGLFPRIVGKGDHAARLANLLKQQLPQTKDLSTTDSLLEPSEKIDSLIVIDRRVDMVTPLLTQLTYEGLIDETMGIKNSHVELPASLLSLAAESDLSNTSAGNSVPSATSLRQDAKKKYHLNVSDPIFMQIRDLNFSHVGRTLNQVAHRIEEEIKASRQARTIPQLKDVVGRIGGLKDEHQALKIHTGVSEMLVPIINTEQFNKSLEIQQNLVASYNINDQISAIEDMVAQEVDFRLVIRLLCLASITSGGVKPKALDNIKREILQTYGYHHLPLLLSLSTPPLAILHSSASTAEKYPFTSLRKSLRLLIDDAPEAKEEVDNDISFTYSGYAPISVRLVQCVAQKGGVISNPAMKETSASADEQGRTTKVHAHPIVGWKGFEDVVSALPGQTIDIVQPGFVNVSAATTMTRTRDKGTTTVVFFLGGCTYTEIAALRWVARQNRGRDFLIATTSIISGSSIIDSISGISKGSGGKDATI